MNKNQFTTSTALQTKKLGALLAEELQGGEVICLSGDLGAGKTTFTQGLLKGLHISGPYTSPTFTIMKEYGISNLEFGKNTALFKIQNSKFKISHVYHIDAYRIESDDLIGLGWQDFAGKPHVITIIEWPERVKRILPKNALWIDFQWLDEKKRRITLSIKK